MTGKLNSVDDTAKGLFEQNHARNGVYALISSYTKTACRQTAAQSCCTVASAHSSSRRVKLLNFKNSKGRRVTLLLNDGVSPLQHLSPSC
jgi:hypothetical protein